MSRPTDIVMACCRDEADIIEPFIDFYLDQGFDRVCLVDNGSRDETLRRIERHGRVSAVLVHQDPRPGYDMRLLEYLRLFEPLASRWIFFIDVDEFVVIPGGIKKFAAELPPDANALALPTVEMVPEPGVPALAAIRRQATFPDETKMVWKAGAVDYISCGRHAIRGRDIRVHRDPRLYIRHYHTRSAAQFRRKLLNRIETEEAIQRVPGAADALSAYPVELRAEWIAETRQLLESDGWSRERARLADLPAVEERAVRDWYIGRYGAIPV